eukprot:Nitzschia sp. Nitz4//scaffold1_size375055//269315//269764//NITZ4_000305-RA/size375055-processed-gene-0.381-mRNA-1//1//CDS//3329541132//7442//frame0
MMLSHLRTSVAPKRLASATSVRYMGSVKKKEKSSKGESSRPRDLEVILKALDAPVTTPPPADAEELARREAVRKAYTIGKFKQHNTENHDLNCKLRMKQHAMDMLPKNSALKEKALQVDTLGPPRWRRIPAWTPPIPGFDPSQFTLTEE